MSAAKKRTDAADPLQRPCTACGARRGQGCSTANKNLKLIARATRLVHAARLEEESDRG